MANAVPRTLDEWEKPLRDLEDGITKLKAVAVKEKDDSRAADLKYRIQELQRRHDNYLEVMYSQLGPWEKVLVARAPNRPYMLDYVNQVFEGFVELQGDRRYGQDHAIIGGPAKLNGSPVMVVGHQKGRTIQERQLRNFGYARPEGYRKAIRLFELAQRFSMPVVTLVDTPGADAGLEAESRGISEAIAASMLKMFSLTVPIISVIIGEGGSGGAIGIAIANRVLMFEHSIYSVIAPEGCAAILWRKPEMGPQAAEALKVTAESVLSFQLIDQIIPEPTGGAHRDPASAAQSLKVSLLSNLAELSSLSGPELLNDRANRFRNLGVMAIH